MNNQAVDMVSKIKFLVFTSTHILHWSIMSHTCVLKYQRVSGYWFASKIFFQIIALLTIFFSFIYPHPTYCLAVWSSASSSPSFIPTFIALWKKAFLHIISSRPRDHISNWLQTFTSSSCIIL